MRELCLTGCPFSFRSSVGEPVVAAVGEPVVAAIPAANTVDNAWPAVETSLAPSTSPATAPDSVAAKQQGDCMQLG